MNLDKYLADTTARLRAAGVETARLDALVLLEDCLNTDRARLLAHPETTLTSEQILLLSAQIERRAAHEPLAYIRGRSEFYGRVFSVDNNVLEPRPESETMIEMLKKLVDVSQTTAVTIADIGTGSGALAITASLELPGADVVATDIDSACLAIARGNAQSLGADVRFAQGDLLEALGSPVTADAPDETGNTVTLSTPDLPSILLCNLPYVPDDFAINQAAGHEPRLALFGGPDGLEPYRKLFTQLQNFENSKRSGDPAAQPRPQYILAESLPSQHTALSDIAEQHGYSLEATDDFIQLFRAHS